MLAAKALAYREKSNLAAEMKNPKDFFENTQKQLENKTSALLGKIQNEVESMQHAITEKGIPDYLSRQSYLGNLLQLHDLLSDLKNYNPSPEVSKKFEGILDAVDAFQKTMGTGNPDEQKKACDKFQAQLTDFINELDH